MNRNAIDKRQDIPKITVITVVYNAVNKIEETILSVIYQDYENLEYIIIDGGSNDGTVEIIKKYTDKIAFWSSSKDSGIYNAMNKGIVKSTGTWINFMNAGDRYVDENVLSTIFKNKENSDVDVLYGNSVLEKSNKTLINQPVVKPISELWKGPVFRHGAMFTKLKIHQTFPFKVEEKYKICADFDFIYSIFLKGFEMKYVNIEILVFEEEGISNNAIRNLQFNRMILLSYKHSFYQNIVSLLRTIMYSTYIFFINLKNRN